MLPFLRKDFAFISQGVIVVRVPKLPMNSLIEIELIGDNKINVDDDGSLLKPQPVSCKQKTYTSDTMKLFKKENQKNMHGEVFYVSSKIDK